MPRLLLPWLLVACATPDDPDPKGGPGAGADPRVLAHGVQTCEAPEARSAAVFQRVDLGEEWPKPEGYRTPDWDIGIGGRGIGVADFDGDGWPDLLVPGHRQPGRLLVGGPEGFVERPEAFPVEATGHQGVTVVDLDGDADLDAIFYAIDGHPTLLWNDGSGTFALEDRPEWGDDHPLPCGGSASLADYDGDGLLDLFYGRLGVYDRDTGVYTACDSRLFRGLGGGAYEDQTALLDGPLQDVRVLASGWHDFDGNGWPDLYAVADCAPSPQPNQLFLNDGGTLVHSPEAGMNVRLEGMGLAVGDLNEDGLLDAVVPGIDEYAVLLSTEGGLWVDGANALGLRMDVSKGSRVGWGLELADLDNDGWLDMATAFGRDRATVTMPWVEPNMIHLNQGDNTFESVGAAWGFDESTVERGLVAVDLDGNGWLDLVTREVGGVVSVYRAECGTGGWLTVDLHDSGPNPFAVGATVRVEADGRTWMRTVSAGSTSYASGAGPQLHFGLGEVEVVDRIEVTWPSGEVTEYGAVDARQRVELWRE